MSQYDKRLAEASKALGANALKMISLILQKHDAAVIEASIEAIEAAVLAEREVCAALCEARYMGDNNREDMEARRCAAAIRARGQKCQDQ